MWDILGFETDRRRIDVWARVAAELGGTSGPTRAEATVRGVRIVLQAFRSMTRFSAPFTYGPAPLMQVYREGVQTRIAKALGGSPDLDVGDAEFDRMFLVSVDNPAAAKSAWTPRARQLMCEHFEKGVLESDGVDVALMLSGLCDDEAQLRAGFALVAELAARDLYGVEALRAIAAATLVQPEGARPYAEVATPVRVVVQAEDLAGQLVHVARMTEPVACDPLDLEIVEGVVVDGERANLLPAGAHVALPAVGSGRLTSDVDGLRFMWRALQTDPARLRAGSDLVGAIAVAQQGTAYR